MHWTLRAPLLSATLSKDCIWIMTLPQQIHMFR
jgi:hypothetical protein